MTLCDCVCTYLRHRPRLLSGGVASATWRGCLASLGSNFSAAPVEHFNCPACSGRGNPRFVSSAAVSPRLVFLRALFNDMKPEVLDLMSQLRTSCPSVLGGGGGGALHKGIPKSSCGLYPAMVAGHPLPSVPTTNVSGTTGCEG